MSSDPTTRRPETPMFDPNEWLEAFPGDITKLEDLRLALRKVYELGAKESAYKLDGAKKVVERIIVDGYIDETWTDWKDRDGRVAELVAALGIAMDDLGDLQK